MRHITHSFFAAAGVITLVVCLRAGSLLAFHQTTSSEKSAKIEGTISQVIYGPAGTSVGPIGLLLQDHTFVKVEPCSLLGSESFRPDDTISLTGEVVLLNPNRVIEHPEFASQFSSGSKTCQAAKPDPALMKSINEDSTLVSVSVNPSQQTEMLVLQNGTVVQIPEGGFVDPSTLKLGSPLSVNGVGEDSAGKKFVYAMSLHFTGSDTQLIFTRGPGKEKWTFKKGEIKQVLLTPNGGIDGVLLKDLSAVRFPAIPADQGKLLFPGTPIQFGGPTVENQVQSPLILITGRDWVFLADGMNRHVNIGVPPGMVRDTPDKIAELPPKTVEETSDHLTELALKPISKKGKIESILRASNGSADTLILADGTAATLTPEVSPAIVNRLKEGDSVRLAGSGGKYPQGTALQVAEIKPSA